MNPVSRTRTPVAALCALLAAIAAPLGGQTTVGAEVSRTPLLAWLALDAPPGEEHYATQAIQAADRRWRRDASGNLTLSVGSGRPRRLVACGIDSPGFVVSQVTDDGYIRLHRTANRLPHPLFDQFHEAQQVKVLTRGGSVRGVVGIANGHFARQHRGDTTVVNVDELWVDVGARSRAEVERMGVALLDPVRRDVVPWEYQGHLAGPDAAGRVGCAAVASATRGAPASGETVFLVSTSRTFNWLGLGGAATRLGRFDEIVVVQPAAAGDATGATVRRGRESRPANVPSAAGPDSVSALSVRARFVGSLVESVALADADSLLAAVQDAAGVPRSSGWLSVVPSEGSAGPTQSARSDDRSDSLTTAASLLRALADLPGAPGHEWRVRDAIRAELPEWARTRATQDSAGNLMLAMGPDRDTTVFIAHMDEVAWTVRSIGAGGVVTLASQGGVIPSAWEGQPAVLDFDPAPGLERPRPLHGVFTIRDSVARKQPRAMSAWFGLDSSQLVARGVRPGLGVTAYKRATRIAATRFTGRAMDDRVGSTALILALRALDPARLDHKVLFVWSVREEGGLNGARAVARQIGAHVRRVYAIDTFVSSDTPLESPHFAFAPLGSGAVLRGLDDGIISQRAERLRVQEIARTAGVSLQVGTTHGSTDATPFAASGAPAMGFSWPGRYSHSPAEVMDLRDLLHLARLIHAVAAAPR